MDNRQILFTLGALVTWAEPVVISRRFAVSALALSSSIFALVLGGIFLGSQLRKTLPEHHLSKESQDVVRLGVGLVATMAALVLGLLIASAKGSYETQISQVKKITADIILLDNLLSQYGSEALPLRKQMRSAMSEFVDRIWDEDDREASGPFKANASSERIYLAIQALSPGNDVQRSIQTRAIHVVNDVAQTRMLMYVGGGEQIPKPFLVILIFWLVLIFTSFSLFSKLNVTVVAFLSLFAFSASCAIFLILELSKPFSGIMMIDSEPVRRALAPLGP